MARVLPPGLPIKEAAVRLVLTSDAVSSALIGFTATEQIDEVVQFASKGPLPPDLLNRLGI